MLAAVTQPGCVGGARGSTRLGEQSPETSLPKESVLGKACLAISIQERLCS